MDKFLARLGFGALLLVVLTLMVVGGCGGFWAGSH